MGFEEQYVEGGEVSQAQLDELAGVGDDSYSDDQETDQSELGYDDKPTVGDPEENTVQDEDGEEAEEGGEQSETNSGFLSELNGLKLMHNNTPFEVASAAEAQELIQKGYDYTQKMQGFSAEKDDAYKEYDLKVEELESKYKEQEGFIQQAQVFDHALKNMAESNPELYDQVLAHVNGANQVLSNPVISSLQEKIAHLENQVSSAGTVSQEQSIVKGFEKDLDSLKKEVAPLVKDTGLVPQWEKVKEVWADSSSGKMTVKQAFNAVHSDDIMKLRASKTTVARTQRAAGSRKGPAGAGSFSGSKGGSVSDDYSGMSLEQAAMKIAFG